MDKKAIIGQRAYKGAKYAMIMIWIIVLILLGTLIKRNITLTAENVRKDVFNVFNATDGSVIYLDDVISISVNTSNEIEKSIEKTQILYNKISKYKFKNNINGIKLMIGDIEGKPILLSDITLQEFKDIRWKDDKTYDEVIEQLNIRLQ